MDRWSGKVAVVTGASSGIGEAIARDLVAKGLKVAALARRTEKLKKLESELSGEAGKIKGIQCDVSKEDDILAAFKWVEENWGGVHIVINNAGVFISASATDARTEDFRKMMDVNVMGASICTREGLNSMKAHGIKDGHIININSIAGCRVIPRAQVAMYSASKHALNAFSQHLRLQLSHEDMKIKVTNISPGLVSTEMTAQFEPEKGSHLLACDLSEAVIYVLSTPPRVNISELTIQPVGEKA